MSLAIDLLLIVVGGAGLRYGADRFVEGAVALRDAPDIAVGNVHESSAIVS